MTAADNNELERLRWYLREWVSWVHDWFPRLGYPSAVPYLYAMRPSVATASEAEDGRDQFAMHILDAAVDSLPPDERAALRVFYLREAGPAVWRSNRIPLEQIAVLCEQAELHLIPIVKSKGLAL